LHLIAWLQGADATQPRQQPAHGQGGRRLHTQDVIFGIQGMARTLQGSEAFPYARQQQTRRFRELQCATAALEQSAGKIIFERADMPADSTLGNRQFLSRAGKGVVAGGGFKGPQGVKRRKTTGHAESSDCAIWKPYQNRSSMSFNHANDRFYPFVQCAECAENQPFPIFLTIRV
jgi:hypothetical protein